MIAEVLLVLAGHSSSLFPTDNVLHPDFLPLLHPGERQCLKSLGLLAVRYRNIKASCSRLSRSSSRYICAFCAKLSEILRNDYESLVVQTEAKILNKDDNYVGQGSFVPLSSIRATFAEWDNPMAALESLIGHLEESTSWPAGRLIDLLLARSNTGIHRVSSVMSRLAEAVQRIWRAQLQALIVHGILSPRDPLATDKFVLHDESIPLCVSSAARESIMYVGRAIGTVKALKWHKQIPSSLSLEHAKLLEAVLPQDQHAFDQITSQIRADISEWLWSNVLTMYDVEDAVDSLANYFLLQNGEFSLSLIREIERLKNSKLTARSGPNTVIREQDLHLALLRASLGTSVQHDPNISRIRFQLPVGPIRPLLPTLSEVKVTTLSSSQVASSVHTKFDDILLGTTVRLNYSISWPLDLFLHTSDLTTYADLFAFLSSIRHVHTRIHTCWTSLSNAQRARRRWTGLDEGGTADSEARRELLRCGWGVVRLMGWFIDVLLGYLMVDVVENEFRRLKRLLRPTDAGTGSKSSNTVHSSGVTESPSSTPWTIPTSASRETIGGTASQHLDFSTLRNLHTTYLDHLMSGSLLTQPALTATIRSLLEVCERFTGLVERWGGDVLPALLFEGSISGADTAGRLVKERWEVIKDVDENISELLQTFYQQLSLTISQPLGSADGSKSILMNATANISTGASLHSSQRTKARSERDGETRRHVERLLLRLDFNRVFSRSHLVETFAPTEGVAILKEAGL